MDNEKQLLISRILAGKIPAYDYEAELLYNATLNDAIFGGCLTNQELLERLGIPIDFVSEIKKNNATLANKKQKLYEWRDTPSVDQYREEIIGLKKAGDFLMSQQYKFFVHSAEFVATHAKQVLLCAKYKLDSIPERLDESDIRSVSRSYEWFSLYNAGFKFNILSLEAVDLINWSKRYENVRQHPECPEDSVIDDDDLLDGWTTYMSNKTEDNDPADGKEVFVPINDESGAPVFNPQRIKEIQDKNSPEAKFMIKMRTAKMMKQGELEEKDLPDKQGIIKF
jgi:hypothetical protein